MKRFLLVFASLTVVSTSAAAYNAEVWRAWAADAEVDVRLRVVDDEGVPVTNARCSGWMYVKRDRKHGCGYAEYTDTNGCVRVTGKCSEWFSVVVRKEGYYKTMFDMKYPVSNADPPIVDGKWQPYGETRTVVLKKIRNPLAVKVFTDEQCSRKIPVFGQWLPFDMEEMDWLAPYGRGIHNDVLLRFQKKLTDKWYDFSFSLEASFTNNPYAGIYIKPLDDDSDLKTGYWADTNATYCANYTFSLDSVSKKQDGLDNSSYLVFRMRTRVDDHGRLIGAHYGKICTGWCSDSKNLKIGDGCFNPVENDITIEGDQSLLYKVKNYKH